MTNKPLCITHKGCNDGLTAALILKHALDADVHQAAYHDDPPLERAANRDVILCDVTFPPKEMVDLLDVANHVQILDHHETAKNILDVPQVMEHENLDRVVFDMDRSAARIAWDEYGHLTGMLPGYWNPENDVPSIVTHVEDRDLWNNDYEDTPAITEWLYTLPRTVEAFNHAHQRLQEDYPHIVNVGKNIVDLKEKSSEALAQQAWPARITDEHYALIVNGVQRLSSILGNKLATTARSGLGITYWESDGGWSLSLRSTDDGPHVGELAERLWGGGGHPNAAGAYVETLPEPLRMPGKPHPDNL